MASIRALTWFILNSNYWDRALKSKTWCNKVTLDLSLTINFCIDIDLSIHTYITCIIHDLGALGVAQRYKSWVPYKMINYSQLIYRFGQSNRNYNALPPN